MKKSRFLKQFAIPFAGLKTGSHEYELALNSEFLEAFEMDDPVSLDAQVSVTLLKKDTMLVIEVSINGSVGLNCDRCGDQFSEPISGDDRLVVKFGDETRMEDDLMILSAGESEVDLSHFFYEMLVLLLPLKRVHPEGLCNEEVLKKLAEVEVFEEPAETDPRWNKLKELKSTK